jgi:hypothetical protein
VRLLLRRVRGRSPFPQACSSPGTGATRRTIFRPSDLPEQRAKTPPRSRIVLNGSGRRPGIYRSGDDGRFKGFRPVILMSYLAWLFTRWQLTRSGSAAPYLRQALAIYLSTIGTPDTQRVQGILRDRRCTLP